MRSWMTNTSYSGIMQEYHAGQPYMFIMIINQVSWFSTLMNHKHGKKCWMAIQHQPNLINLLLFTIAESFVKSNLWLIVNPNLACPIKYKKRSVHVPTVGKAPMELQMPQAPAGSPVHSELSSSSAPSCHVQCLHASSPTPDYMVLTHFYSSLFCNIWKCVMAFFLHWKAA